MNIDRTDVVITGLGPVTSVGVGTEQFWSSLEQGRVNVAPRDLPSDVGRTVRMPVASVDASDLKSLDQHLAFLRAQDCEPYRDLALSLVAIELSLQDASLAYDRESNRVGLVQAFEAPGAEAGVGKMFEMFRQLPAVLASASGPPPLYDMLSPYFYGMQPFVYVHLAAKAFGFRGFCTSVHNACSSGAFAIEVAAQAIRSGTADVMVVAGGEAFDTAVRIEWFRRLGLYADEGAMRPFADVPTGFYVGEGAAAIVLESSEHARARGARPYARYVGGGFAHQAWKQTLPDARALRLSSVIDEALRNSGRTATEIDLVVPHGACTGVSDAYEAACLAKSGFVSTNPTFAAAIKPNVGHTLACSGILETIGALLALRYQRVPPTKGAEVPPAVSGLRFCARATEHRLEHALKLFTGFTGHDAALVFSRTGER